MEATRLEGLQDFLSTPKKIIITTHQKPDGDALGCSLGLYHYLIKKNHAVTVVTPTDYPKFLWWLPGNKKVINAEQQEVKAKELLNDADILFCLDFNRMDRAGKFGEYAATLPIPKVLIDHHLEPESVFNFIYWRVSASSTAELVYEFIEKMNDDSVVDRDISSCLYTGMMTDTDNFRLPNTSANVHRIASVFIDKGVKPDYIFERINETFTVDRLRFFGFCLNEKMEFFPEKKTALIALEGEELKKYKITTGDTEGLVNMPMKIDGVRLVAMIVQRPGIVKVSFRSKGDVDVNKLAKDYFNGGGHKNAAGGHSDVNVQETRKNFLDILKNLKIN
jgi:bifunctional oligoribonuclease and PAP phosphatase NrnA